MKLPCLLRGASLRYHKLPFPEAASRGLRAAAREVILMVPGNRHASFLALLILFALTACSTSKPPPLAELDSLAAAPGVAFLPPLGSAVATNNFDPEVALGIAVFRLSGGVPSGSPVAHFTIGDGSIRVHERQGHYRANWRIKQARLPNGTKVRIEARLNQVAPEGPACTTTQADPSKGCLAFVDVQLWQNMGQAKRGGKGNDIIHLNRNRTLPIKVYVAKGATELPAPGPDPDEDANVTLLVSAAHGSSTTAGNGWSFSSSISANGRYVAFTSRARNLVPGVSGDQVYRRDIQTNSTILVSAADGSTTAGDGDFSWAPSISADGRYAAFDHSSSNLVPGVEGRQIYLRDTQTDSTILVSAAHGSSTTAGNGGSYLASISADGRYVAFTSNSSNLVPGVSGEQVYLRDTQTNSTILVSAVHDGTTAGNRNSSSPSISSDGRYVAFGSNSSNLVSGVGGNYQVYLRDTHTNSTILVSAADGSTTAGNDLSGAPSISADGRYVAFNSRADNLVPGVSGLQVYWRDIQTNRTILVSAAHDSTTAANGWTDSPNINADGRYIAFRSEATNLVPGVRGSQIYLRDTETNSTILMSAAHGSTTHGNGFSDRPSINADGRYVSFMSEATNLVPGVGGPDEDYQVYLRIR
jgi:Tol biopolymer transport system component